MQQTVPKLWDKFPLYRFKVSSCSSGHWELEGLKRARFPESVILPGGQLELILKDVENFTSSETKSWYMRHWLPHRRSYLFYGPPGTGKTSTIRMLASKYRFNCCYLSVVNKTFSNQLLGDALSQIPPSPLLVLENVDALFNEDRTNKEQHDLTFSGLLNALDGLISADGCFTIMTTNHIDRLDKALIRGGRVDRRFQFPHPNDEQLGRLFQSFYPEATDEVVANFVGKINGRQEESEAVAISALQQLFIEMRGRTDRECVDGVDSFYSAHFPKEEE